MFHHLEGLQKKNWKELTLDEKKACTSSRVVSGHCVHLLMSFLASLHLLSYSSTGTQLCKPSSPSRYDQLRDLLGSSPILRKTAYFVSFGPHGPRAPLHPPGSTPRLLIGIAAAIATSLAIFAGIRSLCKLRDCSFCCCSDVPLTLNPRRSHSP